MQALVFVHGYLGGGAQWAEQSACFSPYFRIVAPDLPGYGARHKLTAPDSIGDFADVLLAELAASGIDRFHLLGHSMGGMIVQEMVARAPERVDHLVLYGTGPLGLLPGRFEPIAESKRRIAADGPEATGRRIAATWFMAGEAAAGYGLCAELAVKVSTQSMQAGLTAMESWSGIDALPRIASPTLVLWGDGDRSYPWSEPERLWRTIPGARLAVVPGCAHAVHLEKPQLFKDLLKDFLGAN